MEILLWIVLVPLAIMFAPFWIGIIVFVFTILISIPIGIWKAITGK